MTKATLHSTAQPAAVNCLRPTAFPTIPRPTGPDADLLNLCAEFHRHHAAADAAPDDADLSAVLRQRWDVSDRIEGIQPVTAAGCSAKATIALMLLEENGGPPNRCRRTLRRGDAAGPGGGRGAGWRAASGRRVAGCLPGILRCRSGVEGRRRERRRFPRPSAGPLVCRVGACDRAAHQHGRWVEGKGRSCPCRNDVREG